MAADVDDLAARWTPARARPLPANAPLVRARRASHCGPSDRQRRHPSAGLPEQPTRRKVSDDRRRRRGRRPIGRGPIVYARSTTVLAHLESIDAGIAHIRNEVMPTL